ncbi:hypothetical protein CsatB_000713 [Cannabis sativa]|uniref:Uncharacterized protein n=1 Tax=Cannabis sativa TaxID=3483 RepID=A0A7J6DTP2_CANSA|nr:hypothetical protein F8388_017971 [Cannabis sativa]
MEGLIPFVYKVIVEYKNGNNNRHEHHHDLLSSWLINNDSPMASIAYIRLPGGDSGRFQTSPFARASSSSSTSSVSSSSSGVQYSPVRRRVAA